jgi:hypothetical protein
MRFTARAMARLHHAAFALGVVQHVHQKQSLPYRDGSHDGKRTPIVVDVRGFRLFVEWVLPESEP